MKKTAVALPQPIDLRYKCVRKFFGKRKTVPTSIAEQKRIKKVILKVFPDNLFYDNLNEQNSLIDNGVFSRTMLEKPINLQYRYKKNIFGKRIQIETTIPEQQKIKKAFLLILPDNLFYDDLNEQNSLKINRANNGRTIEDTAYDYLTYHLADTVVDRQEQDDYDNDDDDDFDD